MSLALVLLLRDEARLIPSYIENHHEFVDRMIFADDMSCDGSERVIREVAKSLSCEDKVVYFRRSLGDDFSRQRTLAQQMTHDDWYIHIDADELIPLRIQVDMNSVIAQCESSNVKACAFSRVNITDGRQLKVYPDFQVRLVRHDVKWKRRLHEVPDLDDTNILIYKDGDIVHIKSSERQSNRDMWYSTFPEQSCS